MDKKIISAITVILILVFSGYYIYYNTSLTRLPVGSLLSADVTIGKYLKCAKEGERARVDDNDANMPAYCCVGLRQESSGLAFPMTGDIKTCIY